MRSDAYITVTCDNCAYVENVELTACVRNSWDERDVDRYLKRGRWTKKGDLDLCEDCSNEQGEEVQS